MRSLPNIWTETTWRSRDDTSGLSRSACGPPGTVTTSRGGRVPCLMYARRGSNAGSVATFSPATAVRWLSAIFAISRKGVEGQSLVRELLGPKVARLAPTEAKGSLPGVESELIFELSAEERVARLADLDSNRCALTSAEPAELLRNHVLAGHLGGILVE